LVGSPDTTSAWSTADGPGTASTGMPASMQARTRRKPGSEIAGVPASLTKADLVAAEDTRRTGRLLAHIGAQTPQVSYHEHNETERTPDLVERMSAGATVALVSDAGTPAISDPGFRLVRASIEAGIPVEAVPGPSAVLHALVVSGLPTNRFSFEGFLPRAAGSRRGRLEEIAIDRRTLVLFLSPHRAAEELRELADVLGADRSAVLARELTKLHEEVRRGTLGDLAARAGGGAAPGRGDARPRGSSAAGVARMERE
jgi:16S rRNA (cytidine1402-2'-O)-methyltransferase